MKNLLKARIVPTFGCAVFAAVLIFSMALIGCDSSGGGGGGEDTALKGEVIVKADGVTVTSAVINTELTASYEGTEKLSSPAYKWYKDSDTSPIANTATCTPTEAGTYKVTLKASGYKEISATITVTVPLADLEGTVTIMANGSAVGGASTGTLLTAAYDGTETGITVTYQWFLNGSAVATGSTYTPNAEGSCYVRASASGYSPKNSDTITINSLPTLAGNLTILTVNDGIGYVGTTYTADYTGSESGIVYRWYKEGSSAAETVNVNYTPTAVGAYYVEVTSTGYNSKRVYIEIRLREMSGTLGISPSGNVTEGTQLSASWTGTPATVTYQWNKDGTAIGGATTSTYTPTTAGSYTVTISAENYSPKTSEPVSVGCLVTFDLNGATGSIADQTVEPNAPATKPADPTRKFHTFEGWYENAEGTGSEWNFATAVTTSMSLYAKWTFVPTTEPLTSAADVAEYLTAAPVNDADSPIDLTVNIDLGIMDTYSNSNWAMLLTALNTAGKYVSLDLSACTMTNTSFNPYGSPSYFSTGKDKIVNLTLPTAATSIAAQSTYATFNGFGNLKSVSGANITSIGNGAFNQQVRSLTTFDFPQLVTIGESAFRDCTSLALTSLPPGVTSIGEYAFFQCTNLALTSLPSGVTSIGSSAFTFSGITSMTLPEGLTSIGGSTGNSPFQQCTSLTSVTIPASVTSIGNQAFLQCSKLVTVTVMRTTPPTLTTNAFNNTHADLQIKVPAESVAAYKAATGWSTYASKIVSQ